MIPSPFCLYCSSRIDSDEAVLVVVDSKARDPQLREGSWVCPAAACLGRLVKAAAEEECDLLRPRGVFELEPRGDGLPSWVVWISKAKRRQADEASGLFSAIYQPFTLTAR